MEKWTKEAQCFNIATDSENEEQPREAAPESNTIKAQPNPPPQGDANEEPDADAYFNMLAEMEDLEESKFNVAWSAGLSLKLAKGQLKKRSRQDSEEK